MKWSAHNGIVHNIKFSADQNSVYTLGSDGKLIKWSVHTEGSIIDSFDGSTLGVEDPGRKYAGQGFSFFFSYLSLA